MRGALLMVVVVQGSYQQSWSEMERDAYPPNVPLRADARNRTY